MESRSSETRPPVLAAFSPGAAAREPVEFGLAAARLTGAPLVVVAVRPGGPMVSRLGGDVDDSPDDARTIEHLRLDLERRGRRDVEVVVAQARTVAGGLTEAIEARRPLLVALGSSQKGKLGSVLLGSTAGHVLNEAACPVAVVPKGYRPPEDGVRTVGAAFESSDEGAEALHSAAALASAAGVRLRPITVVDSEDAADPAAVDARVREALGGLARDVELEVEVRTGDPAEGIVAASQDVGLLVIGSGGRGARRGALLGSVSQHVAAHAACPVLILPRGASGKSILEHREVADVVEP